MSRTSLITVRGRVVCREDCKCLLQFIRQRGGSLEFSGCIQGGIVDGDGMDFVFHPIEDAEPFELARQLFSKGQLSSIDCHWEIEGVQRFFNFDAHFDDQLLIQINANRKTLRDNTTDFSWYYENVVSKLGDVVVDVESIEFLDAL